jgi:hypothetical protein
MRSGFVGNLRNMRYQYQYRGLSLVNTQMLVAPDMLDKPQPQLRTLVLPPDPPGLLNARPEPYQADEYWPRLVQGGQPRYLQGARGSRSLQYSKYFS